MVDVDVIEARMRSPADPDLSSLTFFDKDKDGGAGSGGNRDGQSSAKDIVCGSEAFTTALSFTPPESGTSVAQSSSSSSSSSNCSFSLSSSTASARSLNSSVVAEVTEQLTASLAASTADSIPPSPSADDDSSLRDESLRFGVAFSSPVEEEVHRASATSIGIAAVATTAAAVTFGAAVVAKAGVLESGNESGGGLSLPGRYTGQTTRSRTFQLG